MLENWDVEIDEQTYFAPGESEVGEQQRLMHGLKRFHGLQLNNDFPRHHEIQAVTTVDTDALVFQRQWQLLLKRKSSQREFSRSTGLISRFEQARPQRAVYLNQGPDNLLSQRLLMKHLRSSMLSFP